MTRSTDPRGLPGAIAGPGGPHDKGAVVLDTTNAVLLDHCDVAMVDGTGHFAMLLSGRVNKTRDRASVMFLFGTDGAAAVISELVALMGRAGGDVGPAFLADLEARMDALRADGDLGGAP